METGLNNRGYVESWVSGRHLKLDDLINEALRKKVSNQYLFKGNIPLYPRPEFHVSHLIHDTNQDGLRGIRKDCGFRSLSGSLLWWSLAVGPDEISSAERRLLEKTYPDRTQEQVEMQQSFLEKFATSPAFQKESRLGSYRFTFPLEDLLMAYSKQFCPGVQPKMRVYRTTLYKQEVMYVVVVHSPANQEFSAYPPLNKDPNAVCSYKDGCFIWTSEAMCETHRYELNLREDEKQMEMRTVYHPQFYMWDNVAIALHVGEQVLNFDPDRLRENLRFCDKAQVSYAARGEVSSFPDAEEFVRRLWPDHPSPLRKDDQLHDNPAGTEQTEDPVQDHGISI